MEEVLVSLGQVCCVRSTGYGTFGSFSDDGERTNGQ